jgi:hypothetical protein
MPDRSLSDESASVLRAADVRPCSCRSSPCSDLVVYTLTPRALPPPPRSGPIRRSRSWKPFILSLVTATIHDDRAPSSDCCLSVAEVGQLVRRSPPPSLQLQKLDPVQPDWDEECRPMLTSMRLGRRCRSTLLLPAIVSRCASRVRTHSNKPSRVGGHDV